MRNGPREKGDEEAAAAAAEELLYDAGSFVAHKILDIASHDGENL